MLYLLFLLQLYQLKMTQEYEKFLYFSPLIVIKLIVLFNAIITSFTEFLDSSQFVAILSPIISLILTESFSSTTLVLASPLLQNSQVLILLWINQTSLFLGILLSLCMMNIGHIVLPITGESFVTRFWTISDVSE